MLPRHSVTRYPRKTRYLDSSPRKNVIDTLTRRSRITNLGVFLLAGVCAFSLLFNMRYWAFSSSRYEFDQQDRLTRPRLPLFAVGYPDSRVVLDHLIMVPCHSIWKGTNSWLEEKDWLLEPYQKGPGRVRAFYEHAAQGVELANNDPHSLLVFSGGQTKSMSTTTEAESYLRLAEAAGLLSNISVSTRATTENYAMDSYQNFLFSIARFSEFTGHYPSKITVVGYEFKRARFTKLHRKALRWPVESFNYVGVDPEHDGGSNAVEGERQNGFLPYTMDIYGCHSTLLTKRRQRNPFTRFHPYYSSAPQLASLFNWCPGDVKGGGDTLFKGVLPWDRNTITILRDD